MTRVPRHANARRVLVVLGSFAITGCRPGGVGGSSQSANESQPPDTVLTWLGRGGGFREWGCGGDYVYATSVDPEILDIWKWEHGSLTDYEHIQLVNQWHATIATAEYYLYDGVAPAVASGIGINDVTTGEVLREWADPKGWYCKRIDLNRTGALAGVAFVEDLSREPPDGYDWDHPRMKIGLFDIAAKELKWVAMLRGARMGVDNVRGVIPSDDGSHIAVGGWDNSVAMIDVPSGDTLWTKMPGRNSVYYTAFSPDGERVYAGGTEGAVYSMDVNTGDVVDIWYAAASGREEPGHRISCLTASPDGRWVAAGTGPEGLVFVGSTASNKCVRILRHTTGSLGTVELVCFSPDSKALATFVPGTLKIWKLAQWDKSPPAAAPPRAQPAGTGQ